MKQIGPVVIDGEESIEQQIEIVPAEIAHQLRERSVVVIVDQTAGRRIAAEIGMQTLAPRRCRR